MKRNEEAFIEKMCSEHYVKIFKYVYRATGDREASLDITQKVYLSLCANVAEIMKYARPDSWLYKTAGGKISHYRRDMRKASVLVSIEDIEILPSPHTEDNLEDSLPKWLSEDEKILLLMKYRDKADTNELAAALGMMPGAVRTKLSRLLDKLEKDKDIQYLL